MSAITPYYRTIKELLKGRSFSIDEYQREYKWEKKNIEDLLNDLQAKFFAHYQPGHETEKVSEYGEYFLGSIIVSQRNGKNYLVDGQQRTTSLTLLLIYLYRAAQERALGASGEMAQLIFSAPFGVPKFNLDIPERLDIIRALYEGRHFVPDDRDESIQTMHARYQEIEDSGLVEELGDALPHFIYWLMEKVGLIEIATNNDAYANVIFESMNDRGKPLSPMDMLKAYLLAPIIDTGQRADVNAAWRSNVLDLITVGQQHQHDRDGEFMRDWLRAQYAETIRERSAGATDKDWELVGTMFHRWARDNHARLGLGKAEPNARFVKDSFRFFSKAWLLIQQAGETYTPGLEAIYYNAKNGFTLQNTVLLAPLVETDDAQTVRRKLAVTATYLDIWMMRRKVNSIRAGYSATYYAMHLLSRKIRRKGLEELVPILHEELAKDDVTLHGSASQKWRKGLAGFCLNQQSKAYIYYLLARVTSYTEMQSGRGDIFQMLVDREAKNPYDIEHIFADNFARYRDVFANEKEFEEIRNNVASLLLLPQDVNRSLQDKDFSEKRKIYAQQNFYAASLSDAIYQHQPQFRQFKERQKLPFEAYAEFAKDEQNKRGHLLMALVEAIWSPEKLKEAASA
jgi:uncharacterized protein with ParB-like and HNH nuclease domain